MQTFTLFAGTIFFSPFCFAFFAVARYLFLIEEVRRLFRSLFEVNIDKQAIEEKKMWLEKGEKKWIDFTHMNRIKLKKANGKRWNMTGEEAGVFRRACYDKTNAQITTQKEIAFLLEIKSIQYVQRE